MKKIILLCSMLFGVLNVFAQDQKKPVVTGAPFLLISADARGASMGDTGVATSADTYSQQWNAAKYPFSENSLGFAFSYSPYLTSLSDDIALLNLNYFNKINDRSTYAIGLRYFGFGETTFRATEFDQGVTVNPSELALDGSYALKLSESFAMSVTGRYVRSDLKIQEDNSDSDAAQTFAVDVAGFYQSQRQIYASFEGVWRAGFNVSNMGPNLNYNLDSAIKSPLPMNLKVGGGFDFIFDDENKLATSLEFNRLLVENAKHVTTGFGLEYSFKDHFAFRGGYFNDTNRIGTANFLTFGAGIKVKRAQFDLSYLSSVSGRTTPLDNTLRFSVAFNLSHAKKSK